MFDLLLKNGTIITVDGQNRVISDGYVAVKDGIIAEIGETGKLIRQLVLKRSWTWKAMR
ncbi:MAG: hypothetical protein V8T10_03870 [Merdibacter sp.]